MGARAAVEAFEREIEEAMAAAHVPGLAVAAVRGEEVVYARGFGLTSAEADGAPVTPETLFRIGSICKALTGTLIMRLVGAGLLELDRPVQEYVPWLRLHNAEATARLTLRHVLTHTSGLPHLLQPETRASGSEAGRDEGGGDEDERTATALDDLVRQRLPDVPLIAPPGTALSYSNIAISLAGYVAQVVCGAPYTAVAREWLLQPLGMEHTTWDHGAAVAAGWPVALGHGANPDGTARAVRDPQFTPHFRPAGTDVMSTVLDLANFAKMHLNGGRFGGREVVPAALVASMHEVHTETYDAFDIGHGLTWLIDEYLGHRRVTHPGASGGFGSYLRLIPERGVGAVMLYNRLQGFGPRTPALLDRVLDWLLDVPREAVGQDTVEREEGQSPEDARDGDSARHAGTYAGWWTGLAEVRESNGRLTLALPHKRQGAAPLPLERARANVYRARRPERVGETGREAYLSVGFVPAADRKTRYAKVDGLLCERLDAPLPVTLSPAELERLEGVYEGARDRLTLRVRDGGLCAHSAADDDEIPLTALGPTRFACRWGLMAFTMEDAEAVSLRAGQAPLAEPFMYRRVRKER